MIQRINENFDKTDLPHEVNVQFKKDLLRNIRVESLYESDWENFYE